MGKITVNLETHACLPVQNVILNQFLNLKDFVLIIDTSNILQTYRLTSFSNSLLNTGT